MIRKDSYIIAKGSAGHERLKKLTEATWPISSPYFIKAGIENASNILDVGCGNGLITQEVAKLAPNAQIKGVDFDTEIIEIAKELNTFDNVEFSSFNISENDLEFDSTFDFIYARYLLSHVKNPIEVVNRLTKKLSKGGILYLEDVDYTGHYSQPFSEAFNKYVLLYQELALTLGADPLIGRALLGLLKKSDFANLQMYSSNAGFHKGVGKEIALITLKRIYSVLIECNIINKEELDIIVEELEEFVDTEYTITSFPRIFYTWGNK